MLCTSNFLDLLWVDLLIECSWNPREWTFFRTLLAANGSSSKSVSIGCTKVGSRDRYLVHERKHFFCHIVGGVASPLLANIALHGMEEAIGATYDYRGQLIGKRAVVR